MRRDIDVAGKRITLLRSCGDVMALTSQVREELLTFNLLGRHDTDVAGKRITCYEVVGHNPITFGLRISSWLRPPLNDYVQAPTTLIYILA